MAESANAEDYDGQCGVSTQGSGKLDREVVCRGTDLVLSTTILVKSHGDLSPETLMIMLTSSSE